MDIAEYTNYPDLYNELGLAQYNCALWHGHLPGIDSLYTNDILKIIKTKKSWKSADKIFIIGQEVNNSNLVNVDPRIHVWQPSIGMDHDRLHMNMFWFGWVIGTSKDYNLIDKLSNPLEAKPTYYFDALLGHYKPHRDVVYYGVQKLKLQEKIMLSCFARDKTWLPGHERDQHVKTANSSQFQIIVNGQPAPIASVFLPWKIYNQSWFSVTAESWNHVNYFTEKTAKPLLGKRLFVFFGIQYALKFLRSIGFQTFEGVIDESYDTEPNGPRRWAMAFEQVKYLCEQDPAEIYKKILPVLEHNQQMMLNTNWFDLMKGEILALARQ